VPSVKGAFMKVTVAKEAEVGERHVASVPDKVSRLVKQGPERWVDNRHWRRASVLSPKRPAK
ncbi:MAG TPA: hypothetical protein V6D03_11950, partial [Candidatus Caenarcaniphilales bacterium]